LGYLKKLTAGSFFSISLVTSQTGDIAPPVQNKLLKVKDEKQIKRLGTNHYIYCDVQIIAATSRNLPVMIQKGEFREDLYSSIGGVESGN